MKKKIVALLLCVVSGITVALSLSGCLSMTLSSCFGSGTPTTDSVRKRIKNLWDIDLPDNENLTLVNYASDVGINDGDWLYVFDYNGADTDFNSLLRTEKDKDFENAFNGVYKLVEDDFKSEYIFPGFDTDYNWLYLKESSREDSTLMDKRLFIIYLIDKNQLLVEYFKL